jgi:fatty-acyl-CoA synthase
MGAVLHPLNIRLGPKELHFIIQDAADCVCIVDQDLLPQFAAISKEGLSPLTKGVIICGPIEGDTAPHWKTTAAAAALRNKLGAIPLLDYDEFVATAPAGAKYEWPLDVDENQACGMCYTSGTTGNPKGVAYSNRSQFCMTLAMPAKDNHNVSGADVILPIVPYFHANGWGLPHLALTLGARMLHNGRFTDASTVLQIASDQAATYAAAVPAVWQTVRAALEENASKYKGHFVVEQVLCGGSAPSAEMMKWYLDEWGVRFAQGWGMTETAPLGSTGRGTTTFAHSQMTEAEQFGNVAMAGVPAAGIELRIVDPDDFSKEMPQDGIASGELLCRGPWVTSRYYNRDDEKARASFYNGWLATGDIASIKNGSLIIRDRSKDVIKSGGEWISSIDLENHIVALPYFSQVSVVAQPHPKWDERPVVIVILNTAVALPSGSLLEAVRAHCATNFAKYELPDEVLVWQELPVTGTGKISKKDIRLKLTQQGYVLPDLRKSKL